MGISFDDEDDYYDTKKNKKKRMKWCDLLQDHVTDDDCNDCDECN